MNFEIVRCISVVFIVAIVTCGVIFQQPGTSGGAVFGLFFLAYLGLVVIDNVDGTDGDEEMSGEEEDERKI